MKQKSFLIVAASLSILLAGSVKANSEVSASSVSEKCMQSAYQEIDNWRKSYYFYYEVDGREISEASWRVYEDSASYSNQYVAAKLKQCEVHRDAKIRSLSNP